MVPFAEHESLVHGCMVFTEGALRQQQFWVAPIKKIVTHNPSSPFEMLLSVQLHTPCDPQSIHLGNPTTATIILFLVLVQ